MLDIVFIRQNADAVKTALARKKISPKAVEKLLRVDELWRAKTTALNQLKTEQNAISKELSRGKTEDLISKAQLLKKRIADLETEEALLQKKRDIALEGLPNLPFADVPDGPNESGNRVLREGGAKPEFDFAPRDYLEIAERLNLINTKKAGEVVGSRFGYLLNEAVLLEFGLVRLALETLGEHGFTPIIPPVMIRPEVYIGMGRLASDQKEERYYLPKDELYLVGSAEHTIGPFQMNEVIAEDRLPLRYVGFSSCFRREAGSYGKDTKGILRVHQFDKVEMFSFAHPEHSEEEHRFLLSMQETLMQKLELPYRVVEICTGDMGWTDARQFDVETWLPGQGTYRETHSCSNTTDFQARGINTKFVSGKQKENVHMLNATAFAIGRMLIAIIENGQTKTGAVRIPKALQPFVGKKEISVSETQ